jgi:hypothetical protein
MKYDSELLAAAFAAFNGEEVEGFEYEHKGKAIIIIDRDEEGKR